MWRVELQGSAPMARALWRGVLGLLLWHKLVTTSLLEVEMAGKTQIVSLNDDTIISCKIPGSPHLDINIMGITWFWKNQMSEPESKVFEFFGDHQASFRPGAMVSLRRLERGDASLQLSEVQLRDAGEYRCMVTVTPQKAEGRILVKVVAFPNIILFVEQHTVQNNEENYFVCRANGFYPPNINITWEKRIPEVLQFQEITKDITTHPLLKNEDGTFNRTSSLKIKSSGEDSGTVYQCVVWHTSLHTPQRYITLNVTESVKAYSWNYKVLIPTFLCISCVFLCIFLLGKAASKKIYSDMRETE